LLSDHKQIVKVTSLFLSIEEVLLFQKCLKSSLNNSEGDRGNRTALFDILELILCFAGDSCHPQQLIREIWDLASYSCLIAVLFCFFFLGFGGGFRGGAAERENET